MGALGAYSDFENEYQVISTAMNWDAASAYCKVLGKELAPITATDEKTYVMALINGSTTAHFTGVRCKTAGVAHNWSYDGATYV